MSSEQVNLRIEADLLRRLERVAREESLDRGIVIRRWLLGGLSRWELERALRGYQRGEYSLGRAAEEAGLSQWELQAAIRSVGIAYPMEPRHARQRITAVSEVDRPDPGGSRACL